MFAYYRRDMWREIGIPQSGSIEYIKNMAVLDDKFAAGR